VQKLAEYRSGTPEVQEWVRPGGRGRLKYVLLLLFRRRVELRPTKRIQ
jgi:hypothetical protein